MIHIARNILIGAGAVVAAKLIFTRSAEQKADDAALGFTEATGVVGVLGAATNRASGGVLARTGSAVGLFFSDIFDRRSLDELTTETVDDRAARLALKPRLQSRPNDF